MQFPDSVFCLVSGYSGSSASFAQLVLAAKVVERDCIAYKEENQKCVHFHVKMQLCLRDFDLKNWINLPMNHCITTKIKVCIIQEMIIQMVFPKQKLIWF